MIGTDKLKVNHISAIRGTTFLKNQYPKQAKSIAYAPQPAPNCRRSVKVEDIFRTTKSILDTRPIYHQTDEAIRGHVFCSFLALVLRKALEDSLAAARLKPEWGALLRELDRLQEIQTEQEGKHFILRTPVTGDVGRVFQAVGIALPPNIREAEAAAPIH